MDTKELAEKWASRGFNCEEKRLSQAYLSLLEEHASTKEQLSLSNEKIKDLEVYIAQTEVNCEGLYEDLREERNAAQKDNAVLREALEQVKESGLLIGSYELHDRISNIVYKALSQTPTDMICMTKDELIEPSENAVRVGFDRAFPHLSKTTVVLMFKAMITQLLKEREDK